MIYLLLLDECKIFSGFLKHVLSLIIFFETRFHRNL